MTLKTYLFILVFLIGLFFYSKCADPVFYESLINNASGNCPNMLIQKGSKLYLYNSKEAKVPGINPIIFENLEDYTNFLEWQRKNGIRCPVLFLQHTYDTQGNSVYKIRPNIHEQQGGLPPSLPVRENSGVGIGNQEKTIPTYPNPSLLVDATRDDKPYNINSYPSFDNSNYYNGKTTPLDVWDYEHENMLYSPNPMDSNWGGHEFTQKLIDEGYYADNEVMIKVA